MDVLVGAIVLWIVPIFVAHAMGKPKRRAGFMYGFFLGWLGVIILALLPAAPEMTLDLLEKQRRNLGPKVYAQKKAQLMATRIYRQCPHCKEDMRRDASVCPHCRNESAPWKLHEDRWWVQVDGAWHWLDEATGAWTQVEPPSATKR